MAKELAELEEQKRKLNAEVRTKRREMQQAERVARTNAVQELGELIAQLAGASTSDDVVALRRAVQDAGISEWLPAWSADDLDDEASSSDEEEVDAEAEEQESFDPKTEDGFSWSTPKE
ncbi:hypothetical protein ABZ700_11640 [Streptomyces diastaticus]|uniref:hypothetical protein n=1 Tax=Streptomyces diastaticus TaxID=1956 RepID=UPI0033F5253F